MAQFAKILFLLLGFACFSFASPVSVYGALKACTIDGKGRICGSGLYENTAVQIKGISLGWSNTGWESSYFFNANTVNALVDGWKAEVIRVPIGYAENGGYKSDASNLTRVKTAIDAALAKDVYVIIDWHSHDANNEEAAAKKFFEDMIDAYGANNDRIIYEVFNEPKQITWQAIKTYAENVISAIRAKGANNLVLVGTPEWSARPNAANGSYLSDPNVAYVFHFYAATHKTGNGNSGNNPTYSDGINTVLNAGKPVFVSEYGTCASNGDGTHDAASTNAWYQFMDVNGISSAAWQVSYKGETSALFATSFNKPNEKSLEDFINKGNMKESGQFIYDMLISWANSAPWLNSPLSSSSSSEESSSSSEDNTPIILPQVPKGPLFAYSTPQSIVIENPPQGAKIEVYTLQGKLIYSSYPENPRILRIGVQTKGVYVVKVGNKIFRLPIK